MSGIFGGGSRPTTTPDYTGLQIQTAVNTLPIPIVWGVSKLAPNVVWYNNFQTHSSQGGKGSGGAKGGGGIFNNSSASATYTYSADVILALCEGPITGINQIWRNQSVYSLAELGLSLFYGSTPQTVWGYLASRNPAAALAYQGTAYVAGASYNLSGAATLDNHNFEIRGFRYGSGYGPGYIAADADPSLVVYDFLTSTQYGLGFPSASIDTTSLFGSGGDASLQTYCRAVGMALSPALTNQEQASSILARWLQLTNTAAVWSGGLLRFIPYGDYAVTGNGVTFNPNATPIYNLGDDDFVHAHNEDPLQVTRSDPYAAYNVWRLEVADRSNGYNLTTVELRDQNAIELYGKRLAPTVTAREICDTNIGLIAGQLMLQRAVYIRNTYKFRLSWEYCLLDPMDLVTVTDTLLGLSNAPIRITEIEEDENGFLASPPRNSRMERRPPRSTRHSRRPTIRSIGTSAPAPSMRRSSSSQPTSSAADCRYGRRYRAAIRSMAAPMCGCPMPRTAIIFRSARSPAPRAWVSPRRIFRRSPSMRAVRLSIKPIRSPSILPSPVAHCPSAPRPTPLRSTTPASSAGRLSPMVWRCSPPRTDIALAICCGAHTAPKVRWSLTRPAQCLRSLIMRSSNTPTTGVRIGATIYLKFQSFNVFGGGLQSLGDCVAYSYTVTGSALASPLPDVTDVYSNYEAGFQKIFWDEISDFRSAIVYEIRESAQDDWDTGLFICTQAHPPFIAQGNGTFLIKARCQPVAGLIVYSETAASIAITGNQLSLNLLAKWDEQAAGWSGRFDDGVAANGADIQLVTPTTFLDYGGVAASATVALDYGSMATAATNSPDYGSVVNSVDTSAITIN